MKNGQVKPTESTLTSLTIFFPAYNEGENIEQTVAEAVEVAQKITADFEILIINDGSSDNTEEVSKKLERQHPQVKLINHPQNLGYGAALISGFKNASKDWTFFSDGDGQFDLAELTTFIPSTNEFDVIIGYRKKRNDPFMRLLNAKGWNLLNRIFFGLKVIDIDCAFKLFKTDVIQSVIENVNSNGAMISAEFLIRLQRKGFAFKQIPVGHYPRTAGSPTGAKPSVILRAFKEMAYVYRGDLGPNWVQNTNRFILTGILNTITDIFLYIVLSRFIPVFLLHLTWAKGLSYTLSLFQNYIVNFILFSKEKPSSMLPTFRFLLLGIASLSINTSVMFISYNNLLLGEFISVFLATVITFLWEFSISKVFKLY